MKKDFQRFGSLLMALLVLFSTMSFTIDKHFCGNILVDKAIFSEAETCGMEGDLATGIEMASGDENMCCSNETIAVDGQDELKISFKSLDLDQQVFLTSFTYTYLNLYEGLPEQIVPNRYYSPPLLVQDILVLDQVFII